MTTAKNPADLSPSHTQTRQFKIRVRPEILAAYSAAVQIAGTTKTHPVEDFMKRFVEEQELLREQAQVLKEKDLALTHPAAPAPARSAGGASGASLSRGFRGIREYGR